MKHSKALNAYRRSVKLSQCELSYIDTGPIVSSGTPPLFFVHGSGVNAMLWRNVIMALKGSYRCIAVDLPLHGQSSASLEQDFSLNGFAQVLEEFCEKLDLTEIDLVANDLGGAISQAFAVNRPDLMRSITFSNCDVHSDLPPDAFKDTVALAQAGILWSRAEPLMGDVNLMRNHSEVAKGYEHPENLSEELLRSYLEPVLGTEKRTKIFEKILMSVRGEDLMALEPKLKELDVPVLIVWGTEDVFFSTEWAQWLQKTLPDVRSYHEIKGAKLFLPDEHSATFASHLDEFLKSLVE